MQKVSSLVSKDIGNYLTNRVTWSLIINPKDHGAKGDGTMDDTAAIQAAINTISTTGGIVFFPVGTYLVSTVITIPSNVSIVGSARTAIIKGLIDGMQILSVNGNTSITGITIDGNDLAQTGIFINLNSINVKIKNVEIRNLFGQLTGAHGIRINQDCSNVLIDGCYIHDVSGVENAIVGDSLGANRAILINKVERTTISNCLFDNILGFEDGDAVHVQSTQTSGRWDISEVTVENCTFNNIYKRGVKLQASGCIVKNNIMKSSFVGSGTPFAGVSSYGDKNLITGNLIEFPRGINGVNLLTAAYNVVSNNTILIDVIKAYPDASGSTQTGVSLELNCYDTIISDNVIGCTTRGIFVIQDCTEISIKGNTFIPNCEFPIRYIDSSSVEISGNTITAEDNEFLSPYQAITLDNVSGTSLIVGNLIERASIGIRLHNLIDDLRVHGNSFYDVPQKLRTTELTAGQEVNITVSDGQFNKQIQANAIPIVGTWEKGDIVTNTNPISGGSQSWECITSGTFTSSIVWVSSTAYTLGQHVNTGGNVYKCTVAGTSGTVAPTHTFGKAVDGTVTWKYISPFVTPVFKAFGRLIDQKTALFTTSGNGVTTTFGIPHGMGATPWAMVQSSSLDAGTATIKYVTADATNINVVFATAPITGTNNVIMRWIAER